MGVKVQGQKCFMLGKVRIFVLPHLVICYSNIQESYAWHPNSQAYCQSLHYLPSSKPYEPHHEISNNVVYETSKGSDQPAHMCSLIRALVF